MTTHAVFVTGGTGYLGRALIPRLVARGHRVRALTRPASAHRLPAGCEPVPGDARHAGGGGEGEREQGGRAAPMRARWQWREHGDLADDGGRVRSAARAAA
jgi:uncharacterized protein YbjT (DUF2867 family)